MNILNFELSEKKVVKGEVYLNANLKIYLPKKELFNIEKLYSNGYNDKNSMDKYEKESQEKIKDQNSLNDLFKIDSLNLPKLEDIKLKKKCGRKRKNQKRDEKDENHNKFSDDNIINKCKHLVLKYTLEFLNNQIKIIYNGNIGKGSLKKELQNINNSQKTNAHVEFSKNFLKKKLCDIFSENISSKYRKYYKANHNKLLIMELMNEKDENKKSFFIQLFNINFIQCLEHFIGKKYIKELNGLKCFKQIEDKILKKYKEDGKDYVKFLKFYLENFEKIINIKEPRKPRKKKFVKFVIKSK